MINNHLFMHNSTLNQNKFFKSIKKLLSTPKTKTENTQNRAILISSFIFIAFGLYLLSIFYADLETFNNNRKESLLGLSFLIIAASLFIYKTFFFIYRFKTLDSGPPVLMTTRLSSGIFSSTQKRR